MALRTRWWLPAATATAAVLLGTPTPPASAAGEPAANRGAPYTFEDGSYPASDQVLADTGAKLIRGDGNITHVSCNDPHQIKVWARDLKLPDERMCFAAPRGTGFLTVSIPGAYRIQTHERSVKADISVKDQTQSLDVASNTSKGFGEAGADPSAAVLLELRVTGSVTAIPQQPAGDNPYAYLGKLRIGETRACTAVLVDPRWVMTAKSCFADKPAENIDVAAGAPKTKTMLTIGRKDLNASGGHTTEISELVPRADRDLVMARLAQPVFTINPVGVSATAPTAGAQVTVPGFGRTAQDWAPAQAHKADFTVGAVAAGEFDLAPKTPADATVCQGDAGAPALQSVNGTTLVAGITSRSWQGGCLDGADSKTTSYDSRVDGLASWIGSLTQRRSAASNEAGGSERIRWADFDGDGKPDYINLADNGEVSVWLNRGGNLSGPNGWEGLGRVATGLSNDRSRVRFADFDGDGKADYILINADGSVTVFRNEGGDARGGWKDLGRVAVGLTNDQSKVRFADWDGDGRTDYLVFDNGGGVTAYLNRGGDPAGGQGWQSPGKITTGSTSDRARVRFADNDGDGKADYFIVKPDGKVDLYLNRGGDVVPNTGWQVVGQIANGLTTDHTKVQFVDFNADTHADYILAGPGNSANVYAWNGGDKGNGWTDLGKVASGT
ncbi:FG-GAP-like repeat-containing protein [Streptomyces sp. NBC_00424]|uniref:FG-GAP-like repeat-containing protein n=1 Tax=Streptomyces sp. NBC_00424 TaxID=2903648 RepID=UPI00225BC353|nr:FG-GAP-like repeat-containing protein [Streptomyces sp. NBC_00424]MCX5078982.1 FG-GAP-like repeat-containing protein [Streptomyces sp. NBC_00424]